MFSREYKLIVNTDKTEETEISVDNKDWQGVKKLGSLLGQEEDLKRRMQLAALQFNKCTKLWGTKGITLRIRLRLYKALVIPVLMYNAGTWALTSTQSKRLDAYHRKQLRQVAKKRWPEKIRNEELYELCEVKQLMSRTVAERRWSLFGHILRLEDEVPAKKVMTLYCNQGKGKRGRPKTTLPVVLWAEAGKVLGKSPTLKQLNDLAQNRMKWREFSDKIVTQIYGEASVGVRKEKKVAGVSKRVKNKSKGVNKVYRPIT